MNDHSDLVQLKQDMAEIEKERDRVLELNAELLEALEALLSERGWNGEVTKCERKARAAIAKAKGGAA